MHTERRFAWMPQGPVGITLFVILVAIGIAAAIAIGIVLLAVAVAGVALIGVYSVLRALFWGTRARLGERDAGDGSVEVLPRAASPVETYLRGVEEFDTLVTALLKLDPERKSGWRERRSLRGIDRRVIRLRTSLEGAERTISTTDGPGHEAARAGLWELLAAARELERYLDGLSGFPRGRTIAAQAAERDALREQAAALDRRRDALMLRLRRVDLRSGV